MKVAIIGAGLMGHGIASNLVKHGHDLMVFEHAGNQPIDDLIQAGARHPVFDAVRPWLERLGGDASLERLNALAAERGLATESGKPVSYDTWWNRVLAAGGFWDERATRQGAPPTGKAFPAQAVEAKFSGDEKSYPFNLVLFPGAGIADGSMAHLPWLQATPDPMTTVAWQTWIELNPKDAEEMRLRTGDIVRVDSAKGSLETVVYVYPAIAPGTVAMPTGQGHNYLGRYAEKRGANPLTIVDPELIDPATGALAFNATRVKLSKTGRRYNLPRIEGGGLKKVEQPDDYAVVQVTDGKGGGESHAAGGH